METLQQHRLAGYVVSLHERFSSEILEEDHLDQSIDQEVGKALLLRGCSWVSVVRRCFINENIAGPIGTF